MHRVLMALIVAASPSFALAQSWTATNGTTKPMTTAPSSGTLPNGQPKATIPPAARNGEKGLRYGEGAADGSPIVVKRNK